MIPALGGVQLTVDGQPTGAFVADQDKTVLGGLPAVGLQGAFAILGKHTRRSQWARRALAAPPPAVQQQRGDGRRAVDAERDCPGLVGAKKTLKLINGHCSR